MLTILHEIERDRLKELVAIPLITRSIAMSTFQFAVPPVRRIFTIIELSVINY